MLVLDHLTVWELSPPDLVSVAAQAGYDAVSLWFHAPPGGTEPFDLLGDTALRRETAARARASGVAVFSVGLFVLTEQGWQDAWAAMLASAEALGARRAIVLDYDPDADRAAALLARLAESAAVHGIALDVEFIAGSGLTSLAAARRLVETAGHGCGLVLDPLHLQRTGGSPRDIGPAERALVGYAQLCDGPVFRAPEEWLHEGSRQRQLTGEGAFPLEAFVAALPPDVPVGLEIPLADLAARGIGPAERARIAREAAEPYLAALRNGGR